MIANAGLSIVSHSDHIYSYYCIVCKIRTWYFIHEEYILNGILPLLKEFKNFGIFDMVEQQ